MPSAGVPLITVMDLSSVTARAHIPQRDAALLKVGDPATIEVPGLDKRTEGKVTLVSPALDPNSTTVEGWVQTKNPGGTLEPGSSVRVVARAYGLPDNSKVAVEAAKEKDEEKEIDKPTPAEAAASRDSSKEEKQ